MRVRVLVVLALAAAPVATAANAVRESQLTVFAAASLTNVFPQVDSAPRFSFAGSNTLAAQIEQGAPADVFASADMALPRELARERLCSKPVVFTRNAVVLVVPRANPAGVHAIADLRRRGIKLVVADKSVPVGRYTLAVLRSMKLTGVLANVVSRETDVRNVLAKVALGEADAGFVYATDAKTVADKVRVVNVPARAQPDIQYGMCVVSSSDAKRDARAFVARVLSPGGQATLRAAGFLARVKAS